MFALSFTCRSLQSQIDSNTLHAIHHEIIMTAYLLENIHTSSSVISFNRFSSIFFLSFVHFLTFFLFKLNVMWAFFVTSLFFMQFVFFCAFLFSIYSSDLVIILFVCFQILSSFCTWFIRSDVVECICI